MARTGHGRSALSVLHVTAAYYPAGAYGGPSRNNARSCSRASGTGSTSSSTDYGRRRQRNAYDRQRQGFDGVDVAYFPSRPLNSHGVSPALWRAIWRETPATTWSIATVLAAEYDGWSCGGPAFPRPRHCVAARRHDGLGAWSSAMEKGGYGALEAPLLRKALLHASSEVELRDLQAQGFRRLVMVRPGVDLEKISAVTEVQIRERLRLSPSDPIVAMDRALRSRQEPGGAPSSHGRSGYAPRSGGVHETEIRAPSRRRGPLQGAKGRALSGLRGRRRSACAAPASGCVRGTEPHGELRNVHRRGPGGGCPVVASTGTPWSQLENAGAGLWVEPSAEAFRSALRRVLAPEGRAERRSAAIRLATS